MSDLGLDALRGRADRVEVALRRSARRGDHAVALRARGVRAARALDELVDRLHRRLAARRRVLARLRAEAAVLGARAELRVLEHVQRDAAAPVRAAHAERGVEQREQLVGAARAARRARRRARSAVAGERLVGERATTSRTWRGTLTKTLLRRQLHQLVDRAAARIALAAIRDDDQHAARGLRRAGRVADPREARVLGGLRLGGASGTRTEDVDSPTVPLWQSLPTATVAGVSGDGVRPPFFHASTTRVARTAAGLAAAATAAACARDERDEHAARARIATQRSVPLALLVLVLARDRGSRTITPLPTPTPMPTSTLTLGIGTWTSTPTTHAARATDDDRARRRDRRPPRRGDDEARRARRSSRRRLDLDDRARVDERRVDRVDLDVRGPRLDVHRRRLADVEVRVADDLELGPLGRLEVVEVRAVEVAVLDVRLGRRRRRR